MAQTKHIDVKDLAGIEERRDPADVRRLVAEIKYLHDLVGEYVWTLGYYSMHRDTTGERWRRQTEAMTRARDVLRSCDVHQDLVLGLTNVLEGKEWDGPLWKGSEGHPTTDDARKAAMDFFRTEATPENQRRLLRGVHAIRTWLQAWGDRDRECSRFALAHQAIKECDNLISGRDALDDGPPDGPCPTLGRKEETRP